MKQAINKDREWSFLLFIIVLGILVGSAMGVAAKAIGPVLVWLKPAPIETARAKRSPSVPSRSSLGITRTT
ncbi:hypothetical protein [Microvirga sp. BSC39]|uniref:hypothetical protein n=1 Tax=Microvirga sp. BSC39 TaxID=1549810 RepID=UPI000B0A3BD8|nr:hypothetical protein [Microvirga sp. BSC39]